MQRRMTDGVVKGVGIAAGAGYVLACSHVPSMLHQPISWLFRFAFPILTPVTILLSTVCRQSLVLNGSFLYIGLATGVLIDVVVDTQPRNMFPLEMVAWFVFAAPSVLLGSWLAHMIRRRRSVRLDE
jgi:hypothetical protein